MKLRLFYGLAAGTEPGKVTSTLLLLKNNLKQGGKTTAAE
jgi:hypothetical protein